MGDVSFIETHLTWQGKLTWVELRHEPQTTWSGLGMISMADFLLSLIFQIRAEKNLLENVLHELNQIKYLILML